MNTLTAPRKPLPEAIETQILVSSRRRCCLCFHLDGDLSQKPGQIAHVDRDRSNHAESNLAFLCLPHHDQYDSRTSQSKGITKAELLHAKAELLKHIENTFSSDTISISITIKGDFERLSSTQREALLTQALTAAGVRGGVQVISTHSGSVVFRVVARAEDAVRLLQAFNTGELTNAGVTAISVLKRPLNQVRFAEPFSKYSHATDKREVARTVISPDRAVYFDGKTQTAPERAVFGLLSRRVDDTYSLLVLVDNTSAVVAALPIPHVDVPCSKSQSPFELLVALVNQFGLPLRLNGETLNLRIGERISIPQTMTDLEFTRFLESRAEEVAPRHRYELVCIQEKSLIHSDHRMVHLLFALSKQKYYISLRRVGFQVRDGSIGRTFSRTKRDA